jgi:hypothetical protein
MIIKRRVTRQFLQLDNDVVRDKRLALDEHGMLHYLLSLPDDWEVNLRHLEKYWNIGRDKRRRIFNALRKTGWARLERLHSEEGAFIGARWIIGDEPGPELTDEQLAADPADDDDSLPETSTPATAAPESQTPDALASSDHATEKAAVGFPDGRVTHAPEKASPLLRRNTSEEEIDSTNTMGRSAKSNADDDDEGEPPPRFGALLKLWPADNVVSPFACEKAFAKLSDRQKREAIGGIKPYLSDCRSKGQNRLCDFRTYLDERRFEKFSGKGLSAKQMWIVKRGTPQAERWRRHFAEHEPKRLAFFESMLSGQGYTAPSEWPPPADPMAKTA